MPVTIRISLEEDGPRGVFGGISCNGKGGSEVWEVKDWFRQEEGFEGIKGSLAGGGPMPGEVFLGEVNERPGDVGVVMDETSVEVGEAEKRSNVLDLLGGWPAGDAV